MKRLRYVPLALLAALAVACTGTETGNPPRGEVRLGLDATTHDPNLAAPRAPGAVPPGGVAVDSIVVSFAAARLVSCGEGPDVAFDGAIVELTQPPPPVVSARPEREYCSYEGNLVRAPAGALPAEIANFVLVAAGTRADSVAFTIRSASALPFELRAPAPVQNFEAESLVLAFDVATWFEAVDLDAAEVDPESGEIVLDVASNAVLLVDFEAALPSSLGLYADADADGRVDAGEPVVALSP